jgi:hypothetical protein
MKTPDSEFGQVGKSFLDMVGGRLFRGENRKLDFGHNRLAFEMAVVLMKYGDIFFNRENVLMSEKDFQGEAAKYGMTTEDYHRFVMTHHKVKLIDWSKDSYTGGRS